MTKSNLRYISKWACQDRIANFYKTAAPIVLNPIPLERARKAVLGNATKWSGTCHPGGPARTE